MCAAVFSDDAVVSSTRAWVNNVVVGLDLCPFANKALVLNRVRFRVTRADSEEALLTALAEELEVLQGSGSETGSETGYETTSLLIHPDALQEFSDYNQFLQRADALLQQKHLVGVYQIASFHPCYQFAGSSLDAAENYSNRSPFPMLHLIPEASLQSALAFYPDAADIPRRNIALLQHMGQAELVLRLQACLATLVKNDKNAVIFDKTALHPFPDSDSIAAKTLDGSVR